MSLFLHAFLTTSLGFILLASAVAKFPTHSRRQATMDAAGRFGVPAKLTPAVAYALPAAELLAGTGLLLLPSRWVAAAGILAFVLLAVFTLLVVRAVRADDSFECACFGSFSEQTLSWNTVWRNLVLTTMAAGVLAGVFQGFPGTLGSAAVMGTEFTGILAATVVTAALGSMALLKAGELSGKIEALESAAPEPGASPEASAAGTGLLEDIPDLTVTTEAGEDLELRDLSRDRGHMLLFLSPTCGACKPLAPYLPMWEESFGEDVTISLVSASPVESLREVYGADVPILKPVGNDFNQVMGVRGTPTAILLGTNGKIGAGPVVGADQIIELMAGVDQAVSVNRQAGRAASQRQAPPQQPGTPDGAPVPVPVFGPAAGGPVPPVTVTEDGGRERELPAALAEHGAAAVLYWNSTCGFCQQILPQVQEASAGGGLLVLTSNDVSTLREAGITGPAATIDPSQAQSQLALPGTPSLFQVSGGLVARPASVGGPDVVSVLKELA